MAGRNEDTIKLTAEIKSDAQAFVRDVGDASNALLELVKYVSEAGGELQKLGLTDVRPVAKKLKETGEAAEEVETAVEGAGDAVEELGDTEVDGLGESLGDLGDDAEEAGEGVEGVGEAAKELDKQKLEQLQAAVAAAKERAEQLRQGVEEVGDEAEDLDREKFDTLRLGLDGGFEDSEALEQALEAAKKEAERLGDEAPQELLDAIEEAEAQSTDLGDAVEDARGAVRKLDQQSLDNLDGDIKAIGGSVSDFTKETLQSVGEIAAKVAAVSLVLSGLLGGGFGYAAQQYMVAKKSLAEVITLLNSPTPELIRELEQGGDRIARKYGIDIEDAFGAMYQAISRGIPADNVLTFLESNADAAVGGVSNLTAAVENSTAIMNAFGVAAEDVALINDKAFVAVKRGATTFDELAANLGEAAAMAKEGGISLDEYLALVAVATLTIPNTSKAVTGLKAAIANIQKPSEDAKQVAAALGIEFDAAALRAKGFSGVMNEVRAAVESRGGAIEVVDVEALKKAEDRLKSLSQKMTEHRQRMATGKGDAAELSQKYMELQDQFREAQMELQGVERQSLTYNDVAIKLFGSIEAGNFVLAAMKDEGKALASVMEDMANSQGAANQAFNDIIENDPSFVYSQIKSESASMTREVGRLTSEAIAPLAVHFLEIIKGGREWLDENPSMMEGFVKLGGAGVVTAFALALLAGGVALLATVATALVVGLTALVGLIVTVGLPVFLAIAALVLPLVAVIGGVLLGALGLLAGALAFVFANLDTIRAWVAEHGPGIKATLLEAVGPILEVLKELYDAALVKLREAGTRFFAWLTENLPAIQQAVVNAGHYIAGVVIPAIVQGALWLWEQIKAFFLWFMERWPAIKEALVGAWPAIKEGVLLVVNVIGTVIETLGKLREKAGPIFDFVLEMLGKILSKIGSVLAGANKALGALRRVFGSDEEGAGDTGGKLPSGGGAASGAGLDGIPAFAAGGLGFGPGAGGVHQTIYAAPGMDEQVLANALASQIIRRRGRVI